MNNAMYKKVTSSKANKLIKELQEELRILSQVETQSSTFVASINENVDDVRPDYNFNKTQNDIEKIQEEIIAIKHSINDFNVNTRLECGYTIDEALIVMPMLNEQINKLKGYISRLPKKRVSDSWSSKQSIEYSYINFDQSAANNKYNELCDKLKEIQLELDAVNNTVEFNIPCID